MSIDKFTQTLLDIKQLQEDMAQGVNKDILGRYVALVNTLDSKLLGSNGLTLEASSLLVELLPSDKAHHLFLTSLFGAAHAMDNDTLVRMLSQYPEPVLTSTHSMLCHITGMFKVLDNHEILLDWILKYPSSDDGYPRLVREMIHKCCQYTRKNKPFSESVVMGNRVAYPGADEFAQLYDYVGQLQSCLSAPSLLLRDPQSLRRDALLIRKKEAGGSTDLQCSKFLKPGYAITPEEVAPILANPATEWDVLDVMTIASFKPIRFVGMPLTPCPSEAEKALWAFTRMGLTRLHELSELSVLTLARCFQHHSVYVDVCHKVLDGKLEDKAAKKLAMNMIEATMLLQYSRALTPHPRSYESVVTQVLEPMATSAYMHAMKSMRFELYSSVSSQADMMEKKTPDFWTLFSTFREWKNPKVRDIFFASDLGL
ncbi:MULTISPECIES: hypothetical protein [Pseudomonas]|uniref:hypothetical protein n=1 Tax=Pseudomonas TaxID=286 RepID=UPI000F01B530|nr:MULTISPECIES: hypothetical protein [Pseudomonas]MBD8615151.1 hypothetical protein [Pseudomonas putida]MBD8681174.1 hypothetical protein [Pseudomonas sp. CFBP 13719]